MLKELSPIKLAFLALTLVGVFLLVYLPHYNYNYPLHIDEWHHIDQATRFGNYGEYFEILQSEWETRFSGLEMCFHFVLFLLSYVADLVLFYQFLPAAWAVVAAAVIFYITYRKSNDNFLIAWLAVIFFASIKSNVNLTGLWFFTPLTFAIPFIYLYVYLFSEGLRLKNKKYILTSFFIMLFLIPVHSISVLFALPLLFILGGIYSRYILREYKFFSIFLIVPAAGLLFYQGLIGGRWSEIFIGLFERLKFSYGWGVLELQNSIFEVYSLAGLILAVAGVLYLITAKRIKNNLAFVLWPFTVAFLIIFYHATGSSILSPFQRNLYYLALGLPILSAYGLFGFLLLIKKLVGRLSFKEEIAAYLTRIVWFLAILTVLTFTFINYTKVPEGLEVYHVINESEYEALKFLRNQPAGRILATPYISTAALAVSGHEPYASIYFRSKYRFLVERFFSASDCQERLEMIGEVVEPIYIVTPYKMDCGWPLIYSSSTIIYKVN